MGDQYRIKVDANAARGIDEYLEYRRIVGDDDGGKLFTPEEYEDYKKRVLPMRMKNRLFVSWTNPSGMDCICVGPETMCLCQHRLKEHKTDFEKIPEKRPIKLPCKGCRCPGFFYMPKMGANPVRCHCKHETPDHNVVPPYMCRKPNCKCAGMKSSFTCDCGTAAHAHDTIVETKDERLARGHPVGQDVPYKAMGGLTGFSSLAAGYQRLDPSGIGAPSKEWLDQPITSDDHPFLRANVASIKQHKLAINDQRGAMVDEAELRSQMRQPGESELDFYERRYQEREKRRTQGGRAVLGSSKPVTLGKRIQPPPKR